MEAEWNGLYYLFKWEIKWRKMYLWICFDDVDLGKIDSEQFTSVWERRRRMCACWIFQSRSSFFIPLLSPQFFRWVHENADDNAMNSRPWTCRPFSHHAPTLMWVQINVPKQNKAQRSTSHLSFNKIPKTKISTHELLFVLYHRVAFAWIHTEKNRYCKSIYNGIVKSI